MKNVYDIDSGKKYNAIVAAYMRYSSNNQDENSIAYQRSNILTYAHHKGYFVMAEYIDEARTGTHDRREGFQEMMADARNNPTWSKVLVFDLSRFSRNIKDESKYSAELEDLNIEVISVTQEFDNSPEGFLMKGVVALLNDYYSRNLAKHAHAGLKVKASKGLHCGGIPPLGYDVGEDKKLHINEWEAEAVRLIFNMYEQQYSYTQIADRLNKLGYHTKAGEPFKKNSFHSILKQEKYCGQYVWNKARKKDSKGHRNSHQSKPEADQVRIDNGIPAIISQEQFDRVQAKIATRRDGKASTNYRHNYLFCGMDFLVCGHCGSKMVGKTDTRSGKRYYYCPKHKAKSCKLVDIRADELEKFVVTQLTKDIAAREDLVSVFNSVNNSDEINKQKHRLRGINTAISNTNKAIAKAPTKELQQKAVVLSADKANVEKRIEELTAAQIFMDEEERVDVAKKLGRLLKKAETYEAKQYIRSVVDAVVVYNESVEVRLNIA